MGDHEPATVTGNRRIFQFGAFALQHPLGVGNALLDVGIFSCFQVRELLFRRRRGIGEAWNKRRRTARRLRRWLAFRLPRFPLRVVSEAFRTSLTDRKSVV